MNSVLESILLKVSQSRSVDDGDLHRTARLILDALVEGLAVDRASIWSTEDGGDTLKCKLLVDFSLSTEEERCIRQRHVSPEYFSALDEERTVRVNDAHFSRFTSGMMDSYVLPRRIGAILDTPIRHRGERIGVISAESRRRGRNWTDDEASFAGVLSDIYGRALTANQRAKLQDALREANAKLEQKVKERTKELASAMDELKNTQAYLVESEKMAALGGLVSGVAHEVNTPLGVSITSLSHINEEVTALRDDYAQGRLDENSFIRFLSEFDSAYKIAQSNLDRAAKLVADFKKTAVDQTSNVMDTVNIRRSIDALITSLKPIYKAKKVNFSCTVPEDLSLVTYSGAIDQVITNLVNNSCIHGFENADYDNEIVIVAELQGKNIVIDYHDNGKGMSEEVTKRVFEPFYTTKRSKGGSGLGMSISYNLVTQKLRGNIQAYRNTKKGVHFVITLPVHHPDYKQHQVS